MKPIEESIREHGLDGHASLGSWAISGHPVLETATHTLAAGLIRQDVRQQ